MSKLAINEVDAVFLSYGEPNAEKHWSSLLNICPWAQRVNGVQGFDAAHKAAAALSETEWFATIDADNIALPSIFDQTLEVETDAGCYSWQGRNMVNGLVYGNGGIKLWRKTFVEQMRAHEKADKEESSTDFCWLEGYRHLSGCHSEVWINGSALQAFRAGYREGVKLALDRGKRLANGDITRLVHWQNLRNLKIWATVGAHVEHGRAAILGARLGLFRMLDTKFEPAVVRDFDHIENEWENHRKIIDSETERLGDEIANRSGIILPILNENTSRFFFDMMT